MAERPPLHDRYIAKPPSLHQIPVFYESVSGMNAGGDRVGNQMLLGFS